MSKTRIFFIIFIGLLSQKAFSQPLMWGNMQWDPLQRLFRGTFFYEFSEKDPRLELVLYPNRYIARQRSREVSEGYYGGSISENNLRALEHGSLLITESRHLAFSGPCGSAQSQVPKEEEVLTPTFNHKETIVRFDKIPKKPGAGCQGVQVKVIFSPPFSEGSFGVRENGQMHFAGPIFPVGRKLLFAGKVEFLGKPLICAQCTTQNQKQILQFKDVISPLHFYNKTPQVHEFSVEGVKFGFIGSNEDRIKVFTPFMEKVLQSTPYLKDLSGDGSVLVYLHDESLMRNLLSRNPYELGLNLSLMRVMPFFEKYHRAAFYRGFLNSLLTQRILKDRKPTTVDELRQSLTISQWMSEFKLLQVEKSLEDIKKLSESLQVIPFFDAIAKGKMLSNNDVFLGRAESPSELDIGYLDVVFPVFQGKDLDDRLKWCFSENVHKNLRQNVSRVFEKSLSYSSFEKELSSISSSRCSGKWKKFLLGKSRSESISVNLDERKKEDILEYERKSFPDEAERDFTLNPEERAFDSLIAKLKEGDELVETPWEDSDTRVEVPVKRDVKIKGTVEGPSVSGSKDNQVYPRNIEFRLTGFRLSYTSQGNLIEGRQGVLWSFTGEEYGRSVSTVLSKEAHTYYVDTDFSGQVPIRYDDPPLGSVASAYRPRRIPISIGTRIKMGGSRDILGTIQIGISSMDSSILAPIGFSTSLSYLNGLLKQKDGHYFYQLIWSTNFNIPIAPLSTLAAHIKMGKSSEDQDLGGSGGAPGYPGDALVATDYTVIRTEVNKALLHDLKINLLGLLSVENVIVYAGHSGAIAHRNEARQREGESIQSFLSGIRLYGTFFETRDQNLSFDFARTLDLEPTNVYSFSLGKSF